MATAQIHNGPVVSKRCLDWVEFIRLKKPCGSLLETSRSLVVAVNFPGYSTCFIQRLGQAGSTYSTDLQSVGAYVLKQGYGVRGLHPRSGDQRNESVPLG